MLTGSKHTFLAVLLAGLTGCTVTKVTTPTWTLRRVSFLQRLEIPLVQVTTNGTVTLQGYATDGGVDAATKITEAAVGAAIKSIKP